MSLLKLEKSLFFLLILLLPTQLSKHFFLPFSFIYSLPIDYLAFQIYGWDLLVVLLLIVWILNKPRVNKKAFFLLLFFMLTQMLSLIRADNIGAGFVRLEQYGLIGLFGVYIASRGVDFLKQYIVVGLEIAIFYETLIALGEFLAGHSLGLWILGERAFDISDVSIAKFNWYGQVFLRPYATFPHPNVMAGFMVLGLMILEGFKGKSRFNITMVTLSTVLSFSRSAILVLVIQIVYNLRNRLKLLIVGILVLAPLLFIRYQSALNFDYLSVLRRAELTENAISFYSHSPIFGVGLNNFLNQTANSRLISGTSRFFQPVHNIFILNLTETGFVGFVGFISLVFSAFYYVWRLRSPKTNFLIYTWLVIFFLGNIDHYFLTLAQGQRLLFLLWGISLGMHVNIKK